MTDRDDGRLPRAAEAMLRGWPAPPRKDAYWEDRADAVLAEVRYDDRDDRTEELLEPPPPAEAHEGSLDEWMRSAAAARPSMRPAIRLADLARATVENEGGDDRLAVVKQTLSHAVRARQVAAVPTGPARSGSDVEEAEELTEADEIEVSEPARGAAARRRRRRRRSNAVLIVGSTVGFLGFAAGALIFLYTIQHPFVGQLATLVGVTLPALPGQPPEPTAVAVAVTAQVTERSRPGAPTEQVAPKAEQRPTEAKAGSEGPQLVAAVPRGAGRVSSSKKEEMKSGEGEKVAVNEEPEPPPPAAAPEPEPKKPEPKKPEPETYTDRLPPAHDESRPLEPSTGAAMAAIQAVMPNARACLVGQSAPSSATVTFGSDGRVQSVTVSGPPANSGAASCIRVALSGARVSPFAKPAFSIPATVRPP